MVCRSRGRAPICTAPICGMRSSGCLRTRWPPLAEALSRGWDVVNIDIREPMNGEHRAHWRKADIRDASQVRAAFEGLKPDYLLHLAARTGMDIRHIAELSANTDGTRNVLEAALAAGPLARIVVASSLLVCRNGHIPASDTEYCPPNLYGESKVITERIVREHDTANCPWVIVRPTSVWGPWFDGGYRRFFDVIARGYYFHPGSREIVKPLTFAGNAAHMMFAMLTGPREGIVGETFYLADWPERPVREWAEIIRAEYGARKIPTLPIPLMRLLALGGDAFQSVTGKDAPITSFRLANMLTGAHYPWERTRKVVGDLPFDLESAVKQTVQWLKARP